jgi:hypothetical protein
MAIPKITYAPTESDRRSIVAVFGCELHEVPSRLTLGELDETRTGVMFGECLGGYRISLSFSGRPALAQAAAPALVAFVAQRRAA